MHKRNMSIVVVLSLKLLILLYKTRNLSYSADFNRMHKNIPFIIFEVIMNTDKQTNAHKT